MTVPITRVRVGDWLPEAWIDGTDIEVSITQPGRPVEATIVVPLDDARALGRGRVPDGHDRLPRTHRRRHDRL